MAVIKPVFFRPIEITSSNNTFSVWVDPDGVSGNVELEVNLDIGVWGSIFNLVAGICADVNSSIGAIWVLSAEMIQSGDELLIKWTLTDQGGGGGATPPELEWNEIYDIIGANVSTKTTMDGSQPTYTQTMTYRPTHTWIPTYQSADQSRFYIDQKEIFAGNMSKSGFLAGNLVGPVLYWRDLNFVNETAENLFISAATSARYANRNLETFAKECRGGTVTVSGNPSVRGFYFIPDWTDVTTTCANTHTDTGGINFDYSSGADTYAFCQMSRGGYSEPQASLPTTKTRYNVGFQIHTVDYNVSWTYYS
jgi:hypothetical protein